MTAATETDTVLYEERGQVAVVTLNRPQALNSFTRQMHHDLWAVCDLAEANSAMRAMVITGAGRGFCAGADLSEFDFAPGPDLMARANPGPVIDQAFNPTARKLQSLRMPTVAAINGVAAGAGASLALCCDIVIASPNASFIQAFSKIGLIPDAGGSWWLVERLGMARAMALAMTGDKLSGRRQRGRSMRHGRQAGGDAHQGLGGHSAFAARCGHTHLQRTPGCRARCTSCARLHPRLHRRRERFLRKTPCGVQRRVMSTDAHTWPSKWPPPCLPWTPPPKTPWA